MADESPADGTPPHLAPTGAATDAAAAPAEPPRAPAPAVDLRSGSLLLLAILAAVYTLHWARAVFIPLMLGVMLSVALSPVVDWMERWRLPRVLGAALLVFGALTGAVVSMYALADDAAALIETLPEAAQKVRESLEVRQGGEPGPLEKVQQAATEIERATHAEAGPPERSGGVTRVRIEPPEFSLRNYLWSGTLGLAGAAGQTIVVA